MAMVSEFLDALHVLLSEPHKNLKYVHFFLVSSNFLATTAIVVATAAATVTGIVVVTATATTTTTP